MEKIFGLIKKFVLIVLVVILPLFFLNLTQEYFITSKFYLLIFAVLIVLTITVIQSLINKKFIWKKSALDIPIVLFLGTIALSTLISSPNRVQALLNLNFGLVMIVALAILYFFLSRGSYLSSIIYYLLSIILSLAAIVFYFQPFKNISLPQNLIFLKNPGFSPIGNQLDLAIFLGFFIVISVVSLLRKHESTTDTVSQPNSNSKYLILNTLYLIVSFLALSLTVFSLFHQWANLQTANFILPPFRISWYSTLEVLKNPLTAFFGVGVDNFSSVFSKVKDFAYNQSDFWQISSFNVSHSAILQIFAEAGILGMASFGLLLYVAVKSAIKGFDNSNLKPFIYSFFYLLICLLIFPTSLIVWFLFFLSLSEISKHLLLSNSTITVDLIELPAGFLLIVILSLGLIGTVGYFSGRSYLSEIYYKRSLNGYTNNNAQQLYDNQKQAIVLNPYMEKYRISFSQVNLLIANNIIVRANAAKKSANQQMVLTAQDKQMVVQAVQASIAEAKAAISLNPQRATNWENLATIYRNIVNLATGADTWTISAYQRAIQADPQNPNYRLNLGGVYYFLGKYDDAISFFSQTIALKPNLANAHYNLAWALFQKGDYTQAAASMQNVLTLLDPKLSKSDYDKAKSELAIFKSKIPKPATSQNTQSGSLNLPVKPPNPKISPKLELQKEASPSAK